jgi:tRNA (mo5U34)-methyltransferase
MIKRQSHLSEEEIRELIEKSNWWHRFEIVEGITTPGRCKVNPKRFLDNNFDLDDSLSGKRILDVGTRDGVYAFELERRGAEVIAVDIQDPDITGFNAAKKILNSQVQYIQASLYNLHDCIEGTFDIVIYMGVFYHLKNPIEAFEELHRMLKPDGLLMFEGESFLRYSETIDHRVIGSRFLIPILAQSNIPLIMCSPGNFKGKHNWFIPNPACLRIWMDSTGFKVEKMCTSFGTCAEPTNGTGIRGKIKRLVEILRIAWHSKSDTQRAWGIARKIEKEAVKEHPIAKPKKHSS